MSKEIASLKPERVWQYFSEICQIPHPSKKEEKIMEYLIATGKKLGLVTERDEIGNVLITKPATKGKENVTPVIFQSHMDMVCEKNSDSKHNFDTDPINAVIEGDWVIAKETTLGADDGIGVAIMLAILEDKTMQHGPIECLFTIDEETGLTGAFQLKEKWLKGKMLLNLDSEDEGQFFIGCAGGIDTVINIENETIDTLEDQSGYKVWVNGLKGGHSGGDIHLGLGNATRILSRLLYELTNRFDICISKIDAGNLRNAISREGWAIITIPTDVEKEAVSFVSKFDQMIKNELKVTDSDVAVGIEKHELPETVIDELAQFDLVWALQACPHGVLDMSQDIKDFVETSTNLASIKMDDQNITITTSQRSSVESKKTWAAQHVSSVFELIGAEVIQGDGYPGWTPNPNSEALKVLKCAYKNKFDKEPEVLAIHAGLECGLISEKYPDMDMISYGPTLRGVHAPGEKIEISTVQMCWDLTVEFLRILK
ncbi:MAG: aminoacyl-histidine dipeptidase [Bacteroidota bacterium]